MLDAVFPTSSPVWIDRIFLYQKAKAFEGLAMKVGIRLKIPTVVSETEVWIFSSEGVVLKKLFFFFFFLREGEGKNLAAEIVKYGFGWKILKQVGGKSPTSTATATPPPPTTTATLQDVTLLFCISVRPVQLTLNIVDFWTRQNETAKWFARF